jgi:hypothetical protein
MDFGVTLVAGSPFVVTFPLPDMATASSNYALAFSGYSLSIHNSLIFVLVYSPPTTTSINVTAQTYADSSL